MTDNVRITVLKPVHKNLETGFVSSDYPYGYNRTTERRIWIETKTSKTQSDKQRVVTCTKNPRTGIWNKPKRATYNDICVLFIEEESGHVKSDGLHQYNTVERAGEFLDKYADALTPAQKNHLVYYKAAGYVRDELGISLLDDGRGKFYSALRETLTKWGHKELADKNHA